MTTWADRLKVAAKNPWALAALARIMAGKATELDMLWIHPERVFERGGVVPDLWQVEASKQILTNESILLLCSRQCGKSLTDAALALLTILLTPPALILFVAPVHRQAKELLARKFVPMYESWRHLCPMIPGKDNEESKEFVNGSRIEIIPDKEQNIRGFSSVSLIVLDEASRVTDKMYQTVGPMLAVSRGRMIASSTSWGQRGWFYEEFKDKDRPWRRFDVRGTDCKRLTPAFLASERRRMGERFYRQEFENDFSAAIGAVFNPDDIANAFSRVGEEEAWDSLFGESFPMPEPHIVEARPIEF
jgi:hypothetical protein